MTLIEYIYSIKRKSISPHPSFVECMSSASLICNIWFTLPHLISRHFSTSLLLRALISFYHQTLGTIGNLLNLSNIKWKPATSCGHEIQRHILNTDCAIYQYDYHILKSFRKHVSPAWSLGFSIGKRLFEKKQCIVLFYFGWRFEPKMKPAGNRYRWFSVFLIPKR